MCKYWFYRRYFTDEDLWTKVCGRGFADKDLQRRKFGDMMIYASKNCRYEEMRGDKCGYVDLRTKIYR